MIQSRSFQTRARAVDHLGREQIADAPTAISELWKNSFDAYARNAELHLFDDEYQVAALTDDGHGMTIQDVMDKWLVIGTESKVALHNKSVEDDEDEDEDEDRDGLSIRPRQGQKGIGRLSSAALGSLLLLVSKKKHSNFVALLIDWRLFENPYLYLDDIRIPIEEFELKEQLHDLLPHMFDALMSNVWGPTDSSEKDRKARINKAWDDYSNLEIGSEKENTTQSRIAESIISSVFDNYHFQQWTVWSGKSNNGTALFLSDIHEDLQAQYGDKTDPTVARAQETFFSTLISFTNQIVTDHLSEFRYEAKIHKGLNTRYLVSPEKEFSHSDFEMMEHRVVGIIDEKAIFKGQVVAYGQDFGEIAIPLQMSMPTHSRSRVGQVHIQLGSYEAARGEADLGGKQTSMAPAIWADISDKTEKYGGLKVYRDGLRVMPYGRPDNDFFEIEQRRTKNAGRYHYSLRNMVGAISLSSEENINLKDKAGREGFIENKASKCFRDIVILLLIELARRYFGSDSMSIRKDFIKNLSDSYDKRKAEADFTKEQERKKKAFNKNLREFTPVVNILYEKVEEYIYKIENLNSETTIESIFEHQSHAEEIMEELYKIKLTYPPRGLKGSQESKYRQYKEQYNYTFNKIKVAIDSLNNHLEKLKPKAPEEIINNKANRNIRIFQSKLRGWEKEVDDILDSEKQRLSQLVTSKKDIYRTVVFSTINDIKSGNISLGKALDLIDSELLKIQSESESTFLPYINTLQSLRENINLSGLLDFTMDQSSGLQEEVDRLNALAQLGITVEIIGHELHSMKNDVDVALNRVVNQILDPNDANNLIRAYSVLNDKLDFLSKMKLSGEKIRTWITGDEISSYCKEFFGKKLNSINFIVTPDFERIRIFDERTRLYPVFINLINNSLYWIRQKEQSEFIIKLDVIDGKIVVSDNGTGVYQDDLDNLFQIFFTKKVRGGRGVGLYLCMRNLASSGHTISYATDPKFIALNGANFVIDFKGVKHG